MSAWCRSAMRFISAGPAISPPMPPRPGTCRPKLAILTGTATAAVLGIIAGGVAIRRQGIYFAMITLALAQMMYFFALRAPFTGGEDGIQAVPRGRLFGYFDLSNEMTMYVFVLVVVLAGVPSDLSHHQFAVRRSFEGDPRERAAHHLARLQHRPLQARRLRAVGDAWPGSPARSRRWCFSSLR